MVLLKKASNIIQCCQCHKQNAQENNDNNEFITSIHVFELPFNEHFV